MPRVMLPFYHRIQAESHTYLGVAYGFRLSLSQFQSRPIELLLVDSCLPECVTSSQSS